MFNRIVTVVIVVPVAIVLIALAVANRNPVQLTADPFNPGNPALTWTLPLFVLLFVAVALGLVVGSLATWIKQGHYRRLARQRGAELRAVPPVRPMPQAPVPAPRADSGISRPAIAGPVA